jgi:hypothetical protein
MYYNTTGAFNAATGFQALFSNVSGNYNTATGAFSLPFNTTGNANVADGNSALQNNTTGGGNTGIGESALVNQTTGNQNIGLGLCAGQNLTTGGVNIYISNPGVSAENTTIRIGNVVAWTDIYGHGHPAHTATYIAAISGTAVVGDPVVVDANGQLGTATSSARFKKQIKPMADASETILGLKPVTFQYKSDSNGTRQFGLIAEEVARVNPDLVSHDRNGEIYSVRYDAVNAMLLNEFLKEHKKVQDLENTVAQQQKGMEILTAQLKEQAAQIQKVSAQLATASPSGGGLELSKPAPQTALNRR